MNVESNVVGIVTGTGIATGNIEFWPFNYIGPAGNPSIPSGNDAIYDFNDTHSLGDFASMQIHNYGAIQTLLAYNTWGRPGELDDVGIGNNPGINPDWTFENNAPNYSTKILQVYVGTAVAGHTIDATTGSNGSISLPGQTAVNGGDDQTYAITPDVGYYTDDVLVDGNSVGPVGSYTFTNVQTNHTISASFATVGASFYQAVDFSSFHNERMQSDPGLIGAATFPEGSQVLGGIPFDIPTGGNNYWNAEYATGANPRQIDIPVNRFGVSEVHTLINTFWGQAGLPSLAKLEFIGSGGAFYALDLIGNDHIRDHFNGGFINTINGTTTTEVFNNGLGSRLDKQFITLPAAFHNEVLTTIRVIDNGANLTQRIFAAGISVGIANDVVVSVPTVTATYNQALTIPVSISDASSLVAAEVTVEYDTDLLTLVTPAPGGVTSTGTLTDGWSVQYNTEAGAGTLEKVKIAVATDVNGVTGPATLVNLNFTVNNVRLPDFSALSLSDVLLNDGNPPNVTVDGLVTLVGTDATIVFSSGGSPIPRESITVVVTDADADLTSGPGNDNVSVTITNLGNGDVVNATLPEDGALAGTFSLVVPTEFGLAVVVDAIIQAKAGDDIDFTYVDELDANGNGPIPRTIVANAIGGTDGTIVSTIVTQPGDLVYIRVTDADLNTNDLLQESVVVTALSSTTESENNIVLTEDGIDSDIFFGSVATTTGAIPGPNNDGPFHTQKGDVLTITYDDVVTLLGDQLNRVDDDEVVDPFGDADGNGQTQAFDAAKVLLHSLSPFLTGLDSLSANLDTLAFDPVFGKITPFDASLVLQKRVGKISIFPIQEDEADNHPQPQTNNSVPKALPDLRLLSLQSNGDYLSVWADERAGILSGDLLIEDLVGQVEMAPELSNFLSASQVGQEGLHIVFAGAQEVSGPGELMRIYPGVGPDKAQLTRAHFNDGRIVGRVEALAAPVAVATTFALHANYPNPFNPETTIAFDLPQAGRVELQVFDLLGQTVRTLLAQELSAGGHQVVWNGLDASGARVSSGVYFYRLQAGSQVQMRRMLLLK